MTVTPVTCIRPDALIFTGVIHKEGDTSDRNTVTYIRPDALISLLLSIRKVTPVTVTPVTYIRPDALIFTAVIHKEGDTSDRDSSDIDKTRCTDLHCCYP